jgi:hypothetical protein
MKRFSFSLALVGVLPGCGSKAPTKIGADTYYSAKANTAGAFGDPSTVAGELMANGYQHCAAMGQEFELVTREVTQPAIGRGLGGASITFKCLAKSSNPVMRPDNGVTTIEWR